MNRYVSLFSVNGFEKIIDISDDDQKKVELILYDKTYEDYKKHINSVIITLLNNAKSAEHTFPEVWIFWSDMSEDELWKNGQKNPQKLANMIRKRGECLYKTEKPKSLII